MIFALLTFELLNRRIDNMIMAAVNLDSMYREFHAAVNRYNHATGRLESLRNAVAHKGTLTPEEYIAANMKLGAG